MGRLKEKLEAMGAAIAFAEAGEWDTAEQMLRDRKGQQRKRDDKKKRIQTKPRPQAYRV